MFGRDFQDDRLNVGGVGQAARLQRRAHCAAVRVRHGQRQQRVRAGLEPRRFDDGPQAVGRVTCRQREGGVDADRAEAVPVGRVVAGGIGLPAVLGDVRAAVERPRASGRPLLGSTVTRGWILTLPSTRHF